MSDLERYSRQIPVLGSSGQKLLSNSTVFIAGVGGLGSAASYYLVAAGVGKLILVDNGVVELSNLNRQILYTEEDLGRPKVLIAAERLRSLNSEIEVDAHNIDVTNPIVEDLIKQSDVIVDCLDNWESRFYLNELVVKYRKPMVHAGISTMYGQITTIIPGKTPCLACLYPRGIRSVPGQPVLGTTPGVVGALEANEVIKLLTKVGDTLAGTLLVVDLKHNEFRPIKVVRKPNCPVCGKLK